ncbi:MAG TPA: HNH endonuclease, partial [Thalassospira sp.]|nr:HNH endonuclease [Thalassospira sp.]
IIAHPDMQTFIRWIRKKPVDYIDWPENAGRYGRNRRRSR